MTVKIYSTPGCIWCKKTKEFFEENNVKYSDIDVGSNKKAAEEMMKKSGQMGTPVIDANGTIIVGFDESKLKKALNLK